MIVSDSLILDWTPDIETSPRANFEVNWTTSSMSDATTTMSNQRSVSTKLSDSAREMVAKLKGFLILKDNWDTYGAMPISNETVDNAITFVKKADKNLLPLFFTAPGPNGELVIELRRGNREAAVYFNSEGKNELLFSENNKIVFEGILDNNYKTLLQFINA